MVSLLNDGIQNDHSKAASKDSKSLRGQLRYWSLFPFDWVEMWTCLATTAQEVFWSPFLRKVHLSWMWYRKKFILLGPDINSYPITKY